MTDTLDPKARIEAMGQRARKAARAAAKAPSALKDDALERMAAKLLENVERIAAANREDLEAGRAEGLSGAFLDRLALTEPVLARMAEGVRQIAKLEDPVGAVRDVKPRPSGILVGKMRVPLGVVAMIYESRPNVTIDAAALAVKSGNALILRGGHEAIRSNRVLADIVREALVEAGLPADVVQFIDNPDRALVGELIRARDWVDVLVPRGGKGLVARLTAEATVPMIKHLDGICHTYVDRDADLKMAVRVVDNAKTQRYSPCNATETLLVHEAIAFDFLPEIARIFHDKNVEMRCDALSRRIVEGVGMSAIDATEADWDTEYNAPVIAIKTVASLDEAIDFIETHGSHHTDAIITENRTSTERFLREVDSASVMVNASTRFADGFEYGLGAEIGISTDKIHVRGPVGLEGLTNEKWIVLGHGEGRS
ncbi:glutamate-5-semialdehyde dehydrogenase [Sutterella megalosphaeroides]|uniref:Gamma-glutamyl phosphate reductase n=1 Tax=Sutterella megalosphaeroides TaxID=2494234 RepID=A0A2Z6I8F1_9BURK|nr:glutamate-5-semialdehyde dehydrogenase [Sutterella megalosphaeroides]BBF22723.1 gamma-glutamyl phosphate reductase [Sutterella megalosphaeroides]